MRIHRMALALCGAAVLMVGAAWASDSTVTDPEATAALGQRLGEFCRRLAAMDFHGSVLVAQKGRILLENAYGLADPRNGTANAVHTVFSTGSVTKQFTAAAILELEAKKKLSVSDRISKCLGPVPDDKRDITIHQLLTHSSGLPGSLGADEESIGRDSLVQLALATPLVFAPGSAYEYSNVGYSLAAAIVETVSGKNYEEFMQGLWKRAGLERTGLYTLAVPDSEVARSHNAALGYPSQKDVPSEAWHLTGNGGILSTPSDLYRWYTWLQMDKSISAGARNQMFSPHVREGDMDSFYGYGWVVQESPTRGGQVIWHNGGAMPHGWSCALYHYVNDSLIVIVFANKPFQGKQPMDDLAMALVRQVFDSTTPLPPVVADSVILDEAAVTGTYALKDGDELSVTLVEGRLRLAPRGQAAAAALFPARGPQPADLSVFNVQSESLMVAASRGDFEAAGRFMSMPPGKSGAEFVAGWWQGLAELGEFKFVEIYGTRGGEAASTHARLDFEGGSRDVCFWWQEGCVGIGPSRDFYLEMFAQSPAAFASYHLATGDTAVLEYAGNRLLLDLGGTTVKATRID